MVETSEGGDSLTKLGLNLHFSSIRCCSGFYYSWCKNWYDLD